MAGRIRTIKPELLEDEKASALSDAAWRLFVSSWLLCDDHGRFRAGARYLAASVWQDTTQTEKAASALTELASTGRVRVYQVGGDTYAEIPTWARHQRIDNAGKPRIPAPPEPDSAHLDSVSPRAAESRGDSPQSAARAPNLAALPPTTTTTTDRGFAPSEPPGSGSPSSPEAGPLFAAHADSTPDKPAPKAPKGPDIPAEVFAVYLDGWRQHARGNRPPTLDDKRRRLVVARLRDFPADDLKAAARGIWASAWHRDNKQTSFDLCMRDSAHVERFRDEGGSVPIRPPLPEATAETSARLAAKLDALYAAEPT